MTSDWLAVLHRGFSITLFLSSVRIARLYNWERMSKIYVKTLGGTFRDVDAEELLWNVQGMS